MAKCQTSIIIEGSSPFLGFFFSVAAQKLVKEAYGIHSEEQWPLPLFLTGLCKLLLWLPGPVSSLLLMLCNSHHPQPCALCAREDHNLPSVKMPNHVPNPCWRRSPHLLWWQLMPSLLHTNFPGRLT